MDGISRTLKRSPGTVKYLFLRILFTHAYLFILVFAITPESCVLSREATNTNFLFFVALKYK
jgi:hypothetical protein